MTEKDKLEIPLKKSIICGHVTINILSSKSTFNFSFKDSNSKFEKIGRL